MTRHRHHVNPFAVRHEVSFDGFQNENPIIMDIGACRGVFAARLMAALPEHNFLLCEIRKPLAEALKTKYSADPRVAVFDGDAAKNLRNLLQPSIDRGVKIESIFINFPDPWPKAAHHKRRFLRPQLLTDMATWLPKSTEIIFQTDFAPLFHDTKEYLAESQFADFQLFDTPPHGTTTQWEDAKTATGSPIFRLRFRGLLG